MTDILRVSRIVLPASGGLLGTPLLFLPPMADGQLPSIFADFANGTYWYSGSRYNSFPGWMTAVGGTFSRASSASYTNSAGLLMPNGASNDVLRFDYDSTGAPRGILLEGASSNNFQFSEQFDNAAWGKTNTTVSANARTAPDGTVTADDVSNTINANSFINGTENTALALNTTYTRSVYAKYVTGSNILAFENNNNGAFSATRFDIQNGAILSFGGLIASIQNAGSGWFRCIQTFTTGSTGFQSGSNHYIGEYGTTPTPTTISLWGAQQEQLFFPSSYMPTTNSAATRSQDNLSSITGSWDVNPSMSMLFVYDYGNGNAADASSSSAYPVVASALGPVTDLADIYLDQPTQQPAISRGISVNNTLLGVVTGPNALVRLMARWDSTTATGSCNGAATVTTGSGSARAQISTVRLGQRGDGALPLNGHIQQFGGWNSGVSSPELQRLTG